MCHLCPHDLLLRMLNLVTSLLVVFLDEMSVYVTGTESIMLYCEVE